MMIRMALALVATTMVAALPLAQSVGDAALRVLAVRPNVHLLTGAGPNITVQTGKQGVLLVDTPMPALASAALAEVKKLSAGPIRYVVNTSADEEHTAGNPAIAATGVPGGGPTLAPTQLFAIGAAQGMTIVAHQNVLNRMTVPKSGTEGSARAALPTSTYADASKDFSFNGEAIIVYHVAAAHSDGDSIVMFRGSDVVSAGDIFAPDRYPSIDVNGGGGVQGVINGLNLILTLTVPEAFQEGGTKVIGGHGRLCDESDVVEYRDMVWIVRDRVADMIKKRMTLAQIKAAKPTSDYDAEYDSSFVPAETFVERVYASLTAKR